MNRVVSGFSGVVFAPGNTRVRGSSCCSSSLLQLNSPLKFGSLPPEGDTSVTLCSIAAATNKLRARSVLREHSSLIFAMSFSFHLSFSLDSITRLNHPPRTYADRALSFFLAGIILHIVTIRIFRKCQGSCRLIGWISWVACWRVPFQVLLAEHTPVVFTGNYRLSVHRRRICFHTLCTSTSIISAVLSCTADTGTGSTWLQWPLFSWFVRIGVWSRSRRTRSRFCRFTSECCHVTVNVSVKCHCYTYCRRDHRSGSGRGERLKTGTVFLQGRSLFSKSSYKRDSSSLKAHPRLLVSPYDFFSDESFLARTSTCNALL